MNTIRIPIFLNEHSYPLDIAYSDSVREKVVLLLESLAEILAVTPNAVIGGHARLMDAQLTDSYETVASIARNIGLDWWRFVIRLDQRAPLSSVEGCSAPGPLHVLVPRQVVGEASSWAYANATLMISFQSDERWHEDTVFGRECKCTSDTHTNTNEVSINHVSSPTHVARHRQLLTSYGLVFDGGALVFSGENFSLRMPPRDHEPMHVHVCPPDSAEPTFATVRFDIEPEILAGRLSPDIFADVKQVLLMSIGEFRLNWQRRRAGEQGFVVNLTRKAGRSGSKAGLAPAD